MHIITITLSDFTGESTCRGFIHRLAGRSESDFIARSVVWRSIGECNK